MKITRTSTTTGVTRTLDLDITQEQLLSYERGLKIQHAFPNLTPAEQRFFMTGITEDEWNEIFKDIDED